MKRVSEEAKNVLEGVRKEIVAGKVLFVRNKDDIWWNNCADHSIHIIDLYIQGDGLFQQ